MAPAEQEAKYDGVRGAAEAFITAMIDYRPTGGMASVGSPQDGPQEHRSPARPAQSPFLPSPSRQHCGG